MAASYGDFIRSIYVTNYGYTNIRYGDISVPIGVPALSVDISKDIIEIPCLGRMWSLKTIKEVLDGKYECSKVKIPLHRLNPYRYIRGGNLNTVAKSASPILNIFFMKTGHQYVLSRKVGNDTPYLGGEGLIMYENYRPLCLFSLLIEKQVDCYQIIKPILRINPEVFHNDDLLAKHIRTKMLTSIYDNIRTITSPFSLDYMIHGDIENNFDVIISEDINKFIEFQHRPNINDTPEKFNNFLINNADSIFL